MDDRLRERAAAWSGIYLPDPPAPRPSAGGKAERPPEPVRLISCSPEVAADRLIAFRNVLRKQKAEHLLGQLGEELDAIAADAEFPPRLDTEELAEWREGVILLRLATKQGRRELIGELTAAVGEYRRRQRLVGVFNGEGLLLRLNELERGELIFPRRRPTPEECFRRIREEERAVRSRFAQCSTRAELAQEVAREQSRERNVLAMLGPSIADAAWEAMRRLDPDGDLPRCPDWADETVTDPTPRPNWRLPTIHEVRESLKAIREWCGHAGAQSSTGPTGMAASGRVEDIPLSEKQETTLIALKQSNGVACHAIDLPDCGHRTTVARNLKYLASKGLAHRHGERGGYSITANGRLRLTRGATLAQH